MIFGCFSSFHLGCFYFFGKKCETKIYEKRNPNLSYYCPCVVLLIFIYLRIKILREAAMLEELYNFPRIMF
jgi:hypothetical protein